MVCVSPPHCPLVLTRQSVDWSLVGPALDRLWLLLHWTAVFDSLAFDSWSSPMVGLSLVTTNHHPPRLEERVVEGREMKDPVA